MEKIEVERILVKKLAEDYLKRKLEEIKRLTGDASARKYFRVKSGEATFVACLGSPFQSEKDSDFFLIQKILEKNNLEVPKIYSIKPQEGFFLEEDLGDLTLVNYLGAENGLGEIIPIYKKVIEIINSLQKINTKGSVVANRAFDFKKLTEESTLSIDFFLRNYLGASEELTSEKKFRDEIDHLNKEISEGGPKVFCHRDLHSRNIMVKQEKLYLIDFQDARMGLPFYDLVSLLEDCYLPLTLSQRESLITYFRETNEQTTALSDKDFKYWYSISAIQRIFKALGSFAFINYTRNDDRYLKYIGVGVGRLLEIFEEQSIFPRFREIIKRTYHEN